MAHALRLVSATARFFDDMAPRYDADLVDLGWDPVQLVRDLLGDVPHNASVIDAGCGTGAVLAELGGPLRTLTGFDVSPGMVRRARRRQGLRHADLYVADAGQPWPVDDASADVVLAIAMLEFVERLDLALDEVARVLRPGGVALLTVEDVRDWAGIEREPMELRYNEFPLWRRSADAVEECIPPGLEVEHASRVKAYTVLERGFTCAYHVRRLRRS